MKFFAHSILFLLLMPFGALAAQPVDHFVFLIHGLGGNAKSFGAMEKALTKHLNQSGELGNVAVESFEYKTFNRLNRSNEFSLQFSNFITTTIQGWSSKAHKASPDYKISIVAHSQGGVISTMVFYASMLHIPHFNPEIRKRLSNVVTLGTPFWGSKIATLVEKPWMAGIYAILGKKWAAEKGDPGIRQIRELALGSEVVQDFRRNLMRLSPEEVAEIHKGVRVLNIGGNANLKRISSEDTTIISDTSKWLNEKWQNFIGNRLNQAFGLKEYEADMLVSLPSSTLNTIVIKKLNKGYKHGEVTYPFEFDHYENADRLFVRSIHASPIAEELHDIVYTPQECLADEHCDHPTYKYILNYLRGKSLDEMEDLRKTEDLGFNNTAANNDVRVENFGGFTVAVNVRYPKGYEYLRKSTYVSIEPYSPYLILNMDDEIMSRTRYMGSNKYKDSVVEWQTGHFLYTKSEKQNRIWRKRGGTVVVKVTGPAMKARIIYAPVKPTLSTFIDVQLERMTEEEMQKYLYK